MALSVLVGSQGTAFEILQRYSRRGHYDPWMESRRSGGNVSGGAAQADWRKANGYPLQDIRDYRNKLLHGRMPPAIAHSSEYWLPSLPKVDTYCDWRTVTSPGRAVALPAGDFVDCSTILLDSWTETLTYMEAEWNACLL